MSADGWARVGAWRVFVAPRPSWPDADGWLEAVARVRASGVPVHRSKHAATYRFHGPGGIAFVKVYHAYRAATQVKDLVRASKARHVVAVTARLAAAGLAVPTVLAAGERRRGPIVREAWVVTAAVGGEPVADRLGGLARRGALAPKRRLLARVGEAAARLHDAGFVAGDLVPANVWITGTDPHAVPVLLDHDRTRAGRAPAPWWRARRNLVQLNRVVVPGVTVSDRLRVYRAYARTRGLAWRAARARLGWVVAKTIERRRRFDGAGGPNDAPMTFHALMRADDGTRGGSR